MSVGVLQFIPRPEDHGNKLQQLPHPNLILQFTSWDLLIIIKGKITQIGSVYF